MLRNKKTGKHCVIDTSVVTRKGTLYTVKYLDGQYRRYYEKDLNTKFIQLDDAKAMPTQETVQKRDNVIFVDFIKKCKIA